MATLAHKPSHLDPRSIYWIDAFGSFAFGLALIVAAGPLTDLVGWTVPAAFLVGVGLFLLPWALFNLVIARQVIPAIGMVRVNIAGDAIWVLASLALVLSQVSQLTTLGLTLLVGQALMVAAVGVVKLVGARAITT